MLLLQLLDLYIFIIMYFDHNELEWTIHQIRTILGIEALCLNAGPAVLSYYVIQYRANANWLITSQLISDIDAGKSTVFGLDYLNNITCRWVLMLLLRIINHCGSERTWYHFANLTDVLFKLKMWTHYEWVFIIENGRKSQISYFAHSTKKKLITKL